MSDTPLQGMIRARAGLLEATLRKKRPRTDLVPVITKLDAAIRAIESQRPRRRPSSIAFRSAALARPEWQRRQRIDRLIQIDQDEMRLMDAHIAGIRRRVANGN